MRRKQQKYSASIEVDGKDLPVEVVFERRRGHRFSITRKRIIMRLPLGLDGPSVQARLLELQNWVGKVAEKKAAVLAPFTPKEYRSGDALTVGNRQYILDIVEEDRKTHTGKLIGNTIALQLSRFATGVNRIKAIKHLLSRVVGEDFHAEMEQRVHYWNNRSFKRPIKGVHLKYNQSNWGSCSTNGNINLSTRLLFAPEDVQDYVIVHELAHLVELNHSANFWSLVERYMPDYKEKEKWLKEFGGTCDF